MIKLPTITDEIKKLYLEDNQKPFEDLLIQFYNSSQHPIITKYFFNGTSINHDRVKAVLIGDIDCLLDAIDNIGTLNGTPSASPHEEFLQLYKRFTQRNLGRTLCDKLQIKVCPYCNRSYIHTLKFYKVRPQYDHFFSKIKYPYLAVSLHNLIPSCSICNQAKSDMNTYDSIRKTINFLYPYKDEYGYDVYFKTEFIGDISYLLGKNENFNLNIINNSNDINFQQKVSTTIDKLHLKELYNKHKDYVLDIIRASQIYTEEYLSDLLDKFPLLFNDVWDVKRLVYMNYLDRERWGDRVLAKLTYDILKEFEIK